MTDIPNFHDGYLTGVALNAGQADFTIETVNGERWRIAVHGLQALRVDDLRESNIISYLELVTRRKPSLDVLRHLFTPPHPSAAQEYQDAHAKVMDTEAHKVLAGEAVLIVISPSYGAEIAAMGTSIEVTRADTDGS
jgi:hypothetical protein